MKRSYQLAAQQLADQLAPGLHVVSAEDVGVGVSDLADALSASLSVRVTPHGRKVSIHTKGVMRAAERAAVAVLDGALDLAALAAGVCAVITTRAVPVETLPDGLCVVVIQAATPPPVKVWRASRGGLGILEFQSC